jgi:5,10-methenyltetrahydrofolate synthetase
MSSSEPVSAAKAAARARALAARRVMPPEVRDDAAAAIAEVLLGLPPVAEARCVAAYASFGTEPATDTIVRRLTDAGTRVLLPVLGDDLDLDWAESAGNVALVARRAGSPLREPAGPPLGADAIAAADVVIVPALAVDRAGRTPRARWRVVRPGAASDPNGRTTGRAGVRRRGRRPAAGRGARRPGRRRGHAVGRAPAAGAPVTVEELDVVLLVGAVVLLLAVAAVRLSVGTGLPSLLLYVALGLAIGPEGFGVPAVDPELARVLGYGALVLILADGGVTTSWTHLRPAAAPAAVLATVGVGVSVLATAAIARPLLDLDWRSAFLLGAILAPTDAAAVFSVLRRVPLPRRVGALLEAESGFNDAPAVILVVALSQHDVPDGAGELGSLLVLLVAELLGGAVVGLAVGFVAVYALRRIALPSSGLYPDRHARARRRRVRRCGGGPRQRLPRRLCRSLGDRKRADAARPGDARVLRRRGVAGPDRAVRHARPARTSQ